jgi:hypothetical protein
VVLAGRRPPRLSPNSLLRSSDVSLLTLVLPNLPLSLAGGGAEVVTAFAPFAYGWSLGKLCVEKRAISEIADDAGEADDDPDCREYG